MTLLYTATRDGLGENLNQWSTLVVGNSAYWHQNHLLISVYINSDVSSVKVYIKIIRFTLWNCLNFPLLPSLKRFCSVSGSYFLRSIVLFFTQFCLPLLWVLKRLVRWRLKWKLYLVVASRPVLINWFMQSTGPQGKWALCQRNNGIVYKRKGRLHTSYDQHPGSLVVFEQITSSVILRYISIFNPP